VDKGDPPSADVENAVTPEVLVELAYGRIGAPYEKGKADETPPCGVKYLRSSGDGTFPLQATVTWEIHWTGSGGAGGDLPDGTFGASQDVVVQEIQAINR
jgi:enoyl reductase